YTPLALAPVQERIGQSAERGVEEQVAIVGAPEHGLARAQRPGAARLVQRGIELAQLVGFGRVEIYRRVGYPLPLQAGESFAVGVGCPDPDAAFARRGDHAGGVDPAQRGATLALVGERPGEGDTRDWGAIRVVGCGAELH